MKPGQFTTFFTDSLCESKREAEMLSLEGFISDRAWQVLESESMSVLVSSGSTLPEGVVRYYGVDLQVLDLPGIVWGFRITKLLKLPMS